jgi:preprotein translocase subunit YajC
MTKWILSAMGFFTTFAAFGADEAAPAARQGSFYQTLIMIAIAIVFFYFILWRPEQKRRKAMESKRSGMKKGDKVTAMGIVGTIDTIKEQSVVLKMIDGSKIEMLKAAITEVIATDESKKDES